MKRVDTNAWFHTFPGNNSGTTVKTEYYVRSSVLGGQTITELDENGDPNGPIRIGSQDYYKYADLLGGCGTATFNQRKTQFSVRKQKGLFGSDPESGWSTDEHR